MTRALRSALAFLAAVLLVAGTMLVLIWLPTVVLAVLAAIGGG